MLLLDTIRAAHEARTQDVTVGRWRVRARVFGQQGAPPIVLVHGLGVSSLYLTPLAVRLADAFEVWTPDLPGFGFSDRPRQTLGVSELADVLAGFLEAMEFGPVPLLGNSLGCQVLVDLALRYPEGVSRLVFTGPTIDPAHRSAPEQVMRLMLDGLLEHPSLIPIVLHDYLRAGLRRIWKTFGDALRDPIQDKLPYVPHPVLVTCGARDPIVPRRWAEEVTRLLPHGQLAVIPRAPHALNYSAARELARIVFAFLNQHPAPLPRAL